MCGRGKIEQSSHFSFFGLLLINRIVGCCMELSVHAFFIALFMAEEKRRSLDCRSLGGDNHIFFTPVYFIRHFGWWRVTSILCTRPFP